MEKIAVIDNSGEIRSMMALIMEAEHVETFETGQAFLKHFHPAMFSAVLTDLFLPEMNGYGVLQHIRQVDDTVPVIAFTAVCLDNERQKALSAGFSNYLTKPVLDWDSFIQEIKRLISRSTDASNRS